MPDGFPEIRVDAQVHEVGPGLVLGCVRAAVVTEPGSAALWAAMNTAGERAAAAVAEPASHPAIAALRDLYRRLGKEPSRYRGSPEALLRRVKAGKGLYRIHNVVDVINLVSLETLLPIGLYDLARVRPPVVFRRGGEGESYDGIGKERLNLEGLPVLADAEGPFGSPTSDSQRTMITPAARDILAVVFGVTGRAELEPAAGLLAGHLRRHASAQGVEVRFVE
ncbi:MAG TPA: phenylalanine--tRNA ligase beta subunit-related protein [Longimicrobiaceae bacterium]|nr:phenylalanine--tRNA ligase beta subunit-related protein [Longimicrobiaceae bacterium]